MMWKKKKKKVGSKIDLFYPRVFGEKILIFLFFFFLKDEH